MTKNFGPVSKLLLFILTGYCVVQIIAVAYGWSLDQTELFAGAIVSPASAEALAWIFQLGPQVMFVAAAIAKERRQKNLAWIALGLGIALNLGDMYTNVVAFTATWPEFSAPLTARFGPEFTAQAKPAGYAVAVLITFAEELISLALASMIYLLNEFCREMKWKVPPFLRAIGGVGIAAAGSAATSYKTDLSSLGLQGNPQGSKGGSGSQTKNQNQRGGGNSGQSNSRGQR